ncbi:MAG: hybrid sensor histidine kinase/response regulator [Steroidobacteraceae bacterium]
MDSLVKCLLVDDREENLVALTALLSADGVQTLSARSGTDALELLLTHEVALALIDVQMPQMDGIELAEIMRGSERTRQVPIILLTAGSHDQQHLFKGYESGAVDYIYKPIDPRILRNKADVFFQLYRQKQQLARDLQERTETLRLNEMFAAVLGHDLRSPLSAILSSAAAIQGRSNDSLVQEAARRALASGRRMRRMIDDMLDLSRARLGGGIPIQPEAVDLGPLVQRVVREHQAAHAERAILVENSGNLSGHWDPVRLAQLTSNLIGNAIQHGDPSGEIEVQLDGSNDEEVTLSVANLGSIPPAILPRLFDPFAGVHDPSRGGSLGLGLYIVQQIAQAHRGGVKVLSNGGTHTVFTVRMPRAAAPIA